MDLKEICEKAKQEHELNQKQLAEKIGMSEQNFSAALKRRRKLPAEAAIELAELSGMRAKEVWDAAKRWASQAAMPLAFAALIGVSFFLSAVPYPAYASTGYSGNNDTVQIMAVRHIVARRHRRTAVQPLAAADAFLVAARD